MNILSEWWLAPFRDMPKYVVRNFLSAVRREAITGAAAGECCKPPNFINTWQSLFWRNGLVPAPDSSPATLEGDPSVPLAGEVQGRVRSIALRSYRNSGQADRVLPSRTQKFIFHVWNLTSFRSVRGSRMSRKAARISGWLDIGPVALLETHWCETDLARFETYFMNAHILHTAAYIGDRGGVGGGVCMLFPSQLGWRVLEHKELLAGGALAVLAEHHGQLYSFVALYARHPTPQQFFAALSHPLREWTRGLPPCIRIVIGDWNHHAPAGLPAEESGPLDALIAECLTAGAVTEVAQAGAAEGAARPTFATHDGTPRFIDRAAVGDSLGADAAPLVWDLQCPGADLPTRNHHHPLRLTLAPSPAPPTASCEPYEPIPPYACAGSKPEVAELRRRLVRRSLLHGMPFGATTDAQAGINRAVERAFSEDSPGVIGQGPARHNEGRPTWSEDSEALVQHKALEVLRDLAHTTRTWFDSLSARSKGQLRSAVGLVQDALREQPGSVVKVAIGALEYLEDAVGQPSAENRVCVNGLIAVQRVHVEDVLQSYQREREATLRRPGQAGAPPPDGKPVTQRRLYRRTKAVLPGAKGGVGGWN